MAVGAMTILGSFGARLGLDSSDYAKGIINAEGLTRVFGNTFTTFLSNPLLGSIDLLKQVGGAFINKSQAVLADAEALARLSNQTGASIELIQALRGELDLAAGAGDKAEVALAKFATILGRAQQGSKTEVDLFRRLGLDPQSIGSVDQAFGLVLEQISKLETAQARIAFASVIFGEEDGRRIIDTVGGGIEALDQMIARQRSLASVIDGQTVRSLANFNTTAGSAQQLLENLNPRLLSEFLAGFAGGFDTGAEGVSELGDALQERLLPRVRELGQSASDFVGTMDDVIDRVETLLGLMDKLVELETVGTFGGKTVPGVSQGAALQNYASQDARSIFTGDFSTLFKFDRFGIFGGGGDP